MKRLLFMLLLAAYMTGGAVPILSRAFHIGPTTVHAQDDDDQGENNDDQGENEQ